MHNTPQYNTHTAQQQPRYKPQYKQTTIRNTPHTHNTKQRDKTHNTHNKTTHTRARFNNHNTKHIIQKRC